MVRDTRDLSLEDLAPGQVIGSPLTGAEPSGIDSGGHIVKHGTLKAKTFAVARLLIAEEGYESLTMNRLSTETGISRQTIYNNVGGREEIIINAINEYNNELVTRTLALEDGPESILFLAHKYFECSISNKRYISEATKLLFDPSYPKSNKLHQCGSKLLYPYFRTMVGEGWIEPATNCWMLAQHISWINSLTIHSWMMTNGDTRDLRRQILFGNRIAMLGAATREGRERVERYRA